jgi:hypothetical protein
MEKKRSKKEIKEKRHKRWVVIITISTFLITMLISYISDLLLSNTPIFVAFIILFVIVCIGIVGDVIGVAITAVSIGPFNAMASKKIKGAKTSVSLVKNASRVSNFCNDVIGDVCGILSGATSITIVMQLAQHYPALNLAIITLVLSSTVASITVGGKAVGKDFALKNGTWIIHGISILIASVKLAVRGSE